MVLHRFDRLTRDDAANPPKFMPADDLLPDQQGPLCVTSYGLRPSRNLMTTWGKVLYHAVVELFRTRSHRLSSRKDPSRSCLARTGEGYVASVSAPTG